MGDAATMRWTRVAKTGLAAGAAVAVAAWGSGAASAARAKPTRTELVSVARGRAAAEGATLDPSVSAGGFMVAFTSKSADLPGADGNMNVYVRDLRRGTTLRASLGYREAPNGDSFGGRISADGRYVAFVSRATNLVPGEDTPLTDVFVRDLVKRTTVRASVADDGGALDRPSDSPSISAHGRFVAFTSAAHDVGDGATDAAVDVFLRDLRAKTTVRVSQSLDGGGADGDSAAPSVSDDGRYVAFESEATNLVSRDAAGVRDVFVRDLRKGATRRLSVGVDGAEANAPSMGASISGNGRYVAFCSMASNLVADDVDATLDVFVADVKTGRIVRISAGAGGTQPDSFSGVPTFSDNGRYVVFPSYASNLVEGDTNGAFDVFRHDRVRGQTVRASVGDGGAQLDGASVGGVVDSHGNVIFVSAAAATPSARAGTAFSLFRSVR